MAIRLTEKRLRQIIREEILKEGDDWAPFPEMRGGTRSRSVPSTVSNSMRLDAETASEIKGAVARLGGRFVQGMPLPIGTKNIVLVKYGGAWGLGSLESTRAAWEPRLQEILTPLGLDWRWLGSNIWTGDGGEIAWEIAPVSR